ncbi:MAG: LysR family transcriptional regulator [Deltaproteobacteria bacterium]|nr:LysR family transcriptional regulator [Deltaproteobacteria bacterium]
MLDLHRLNIFIKIVELKSFSKAARRLFLTQPTVSQHVNFLERYLGVPLFDRLGKEVRPTRAGRILHTYALRLLRMADDAECAVAFLKGTKSGTIVAGASNIPGEYVLPGILGRFKAMYPEIAVTVHLGDTGGIVEKIVNYEIDFGVIGARIAHDQLQCTRFIDDELCLIIAPVHPWAGRRDVEVSELLTVPFVMRESGSGTRLMVEQALSKAGLQPSRLSIIAELGSNSAIKQAVKAGLGISFVSARSVADEIGMKLIMTLPVQGLQIRRSFYIARHKKRTLPPVVREFYQFLLKQR